MTTKLNHRLPLSADSKARFDADLEKDLRQRATMTMSFGIRSDNGDDVDVDSAPCALSINPTNPDSVDVQAGTVMFKNGEIVEVKTGDILGLAINEAETDSVLVRLEYSESGQGTAALTVLGDSLLFPVVAVKPVRELVVVETVTSYLAQSPTVKNNSVVLGVCHYDTAELVVDNSRDTHDFNRPWCTVVDDQHRSQVGSAAVTPQNPHGQQFSDFGVGSFTAAEVLTGGPSMVVAKASSFGRVAGSLCVVNIPAGSFAIDTTGRITGVAGARYAVLGYYPQQLLRVALQSSAAEVAGWIPPGRNVIAIVDPFRFATAQAVTVSYTIVQAGALPAVVSGSSLEVLQPTENEVLVAGGGTMLDIQEPRVVFSDAGMVPTGFDLWLSADGKVFKRPDVLLCSTRLENLGAGVFLLSSQPISPTRLRVAISDYLSGTDEVKIQFTGRNAAGSVITEIVTFSGPLPNITPSYYEIAGQRKFTVNEFASVTQGQIVSRVGDGPSTSVTIFAEYAPENGESANALFLGSVHWTGASVTNNYSFASHVALDRRPVVRGGRAARTPAVAATAAGLFSSLSFGGANLNVSKSAVITEDFSTPSYLDVFDGPVLPANSDSIPLGYRSRIIPLTSSYSASFLNMVLVPAGGRPSTPLGNGGDVRVSLEFFRSTGVVTTVSGNVSTTNPYGPYRVSFGASPGALSAYAVRVTISSQDGAPYLPDVWGGFVLAISDGPA